MADTPPPVAIVCVGMAGSGKTTFLQRINAHLHSQRRPPYVLNLDPAVLHVPFEPNIDIRDSVDYKEVMRQYGLGPNGGILTSLNLFATKIDQVLGILDKRTAASPAQSGHRRIEHVLVDTPGQIEVFVWSASGDILLGALASSMPTVIAYIIDTPRTAATSTFMSNMLYACSILYKTKLPMILVFNKTDVKDADFAKDWMTDFESFQAALRGDEGSGSFGGAEGSGQGSGYMGSLLHSMSLMLEEFYKHLRVVGLSSMTGQGVDDFFEAVQEKKDEFERDYKPELERRRQERDNIRGQMREKELGKLLADLNVQDGSGSRAKGNITRQRRKKEEPETISDLEDAGEEEEDEEKDEAEAGMVSPDEDDEEGDEVDEAEDGLKKRYKQALLDSSGGPSSEDFSFAKYLHKANLGGG